jgi:three-Cys-motif partner protein
MTEDRSRAPAKKTSHRFGGSWTEVKLEAIMDYLGFFTSALRAKPRPERPFTLWYVDAFAGTGERTETRLVGGLLDGQPVSEAEVTLDGSAKRALAVSPSFKHFTFIERDAQRFACLQEVERVNAGRGIKLENRDANEALQELFRSPPWSMQIGGKGLHRGVVFLDPYGMAVRWETLQVLANTGAIDIWYLFPLNAVTRQLAKDFGAVDSKKQAKLDEIFGTPDWRTQLYKVRLPEQSDLFDLPPSKTVREATPRQIEVYAQTRLRTLFPYVSEALPLLMPGRAQLFSLFCLSANENPIAQNLIDRGVSFVLKKYG